MERYSGNCAFILACNHPSALIEPIRSRCSLVTFRPIPEKDLAARISEIAEAERVPLGDRAAEGIATASSGDMRRALGILQAAAAISSVVDLDTVFGLASTPASDTVDEMLGRALDGDVMKARDSLDSLLIEGGMSGRDIMELVQLRALALGLPDLDTVRLIDRIGEIDERIAQCGSNGTDSPIERVQIEMLLAYLAMTGRKRRRWSPAARIPCRQGDGILKPVRGWEGPRPPTSSDEDAQMQIVRQPVHIPLLSDDVPVVDIGRHGVVSGSIGGRPACGVDLHRHAPVGPVRDRDRGAIGVIGIVFDRGLGDELLDRADEDALVRRGSVELPVRRPEGVSSDTRRRSRPRSCFR